MLVYPQLASGALSQFPVQMRRRVRTLVNTAADGTTVKWGDEGAAATEWQLQYGDLSDGELAELVGFFTAAAGTLNGFTFVDPGANLLGWSNDLSNAVWNAGPEMARSGAGADPDGGTQAWQVVNTGAGAQTLSQTVEAPGGYLYCFSLWAKAAAPGAVTLLLGDSRNARTVGANWQRLACSGTSDPAAAAVTFGIELGAGAAVEVYGLQVEPQGSPSGYKASTTGGCYQNARLRDDELSITTTGLNRHRATVNIIHASNL